MRFFEVLMLKSRALFVPNDWNNLCVKTRSAARIFFYRRTPVLRYFRRKSTWRKLNLIFLLVQTCLLLKNDGTSSYIWTKLDDLVELLWLKNMFFSWFCSSDHSNAGNLTIHNTKNTNQKSTNCHPWSVHELLRWQRQSVGILFGD